MLNTAPNKVLRSFREEKKMQVLFDLYVFYPPPRICWHHSSSCVLENETFSVAASNTGDVK